MIHDKTLKDQRTVSDKKDVIYHIKCPDCPDSYIGETGRQTK